METLDLPSLIGGGGVVAILAWIVIRIMNQSSGDRKQYTDALKEERADHDAELQRLHERYDSQLKAHSTQITELRLEIADVRSQLEVERKARWLAEDAAAKYRRMAGVSDDE